MREPLLIGQAPGLSTDPGRPLYPYPATSTGGRLAEIMGIQPSEYIRRFECINLLQNYPGRTGRDDKFPRREARVAARAIAPLLRDRTVILVGRNVAEAFQLDLPFHCWSPDENSPWARIAVVPHTSGRNRWYNEPGNIEEARTFWAYVLERHTLPAGQLPTIHERRIQQHRLLEARKELGNQ